MSNESKTTVDTIRQAKKIYGQVSRLMETADGLMREANWTTDNNTAIYGSAAVYNPTQWLRVSG